MKKIVIVGGGIAGLVTAYRLRDSGAHVTLLEARDRLGGTIVTERTRGFLIEGGPDSFITQKPWGLELCRELGIEEELVPTASRKVYIYSRRKLRPLPAGMMLTVPTRVLPMLFSGLISLPGKLRMALDLLIPRGTHGGDESIASFVGRRLGREAVDKIAEPLMAGIYTAPADRLSLQATFPRLLQMEQDNRSLILAFRKIPSTGASPFRAFKGGMSRFVEVLQDRLNGVNVVTGAPAREVRRGRVGYRVEFEGGDLEADHLILTLEAPLAARILRGQAPELARKIDSIPYASTATVSLGYENARELDATGFVIPKKEKRRILACTWSSTKFEGRAPEGGILVRCFFGGYGAEEKIEGTDEELITVAREELREMMGLEGEPAVARVFRWKKTNPIYEVGHAERVEAIEQALKEHPGLELTGSGYRGVGIPDCINDATQIAARIT